MVVHIFATSNVLLSFELFLRLLWLHLLLLLLRVSLLNDIRRRRHRHVPVFIRRVAICLVLDIFVPRNFYLDLPTAIFVTFFRHLNVQSRLGPRSAATIVSRPSGTFTTTPRICLRRHPSRVRFFRILPRTTGRTLMLARICVFLVASVVSFVIVIRVVHISRSATRRRVPRLALVPL